LARMRYGRGQSLAYLSSASSPWAKDWLAEKPGEYAAFWRQAVLSVLGPPYRALEPQVEYRGGQAVATLAALPEGRLEISRLVGDNISTVPATTTIETAGAEAVLVTAKGKANEAWGWSRSFGREFADPADGVKTLQELSRLTGGTFGAGEEAFGAAQGRVRVQVDAAWWLVAAMILLVVELLLRRLPALTAVFARQTTRTAADARG
jgi:hypothetical protein